MSQMSIDDAATILLVFAFFNVRNADFYEQILSLIGSKGQISPGLSWAVDPRIAGLIYRGVKLLPEPVRIPQSVTEILEASLTKFGPLALSSMVPGIRDLEALKQMDSELDDESLYKMRAFQIAIMRDIYNILQQVFGSGGTESTAETLPVAKFEPAMSDGWLLTHISIRKEGYRIAYQVIGDDLICSNDRSRYKGQVQSEISVMQRAGGWVVVVFTISEWV